MNAKLKKRLIVVTGIIAVVIAAILAIVGNGTAAKSLTVSEAMAQPPVGDKVQVSGSVVDDSFSTTGNTLTFKIYDAEGSSDAQLSVRYDGAASSTFGNGVTAICTGRINDEGVLECTELVTKCPSKYENSESALSVSRLLDYGENIEGTTVKVAGQIVSDSINPIGQDCRFKIEDAPTGKGEDELEVIYDGVLATDIGNKTSVVLTGSMNEDGKFFATAVNVGE